MSEYKKNDPLLEGFGDPKNQKQMGSRNKPVVFMFQPETFEVVSSDKLRQWERLMIEKVGLKPGTMGDITTGTISCCPDCDDCDQ